MTDLRRYRYDDLRRFASALAAGVGISPTRASTLATHLLWFDAAGAATHGIASLPGLLDKVDARLIDPLAESAVAAERPSTAVLDGRGGVPLLVLERAGGIAVEKARDTGVGLVRVQNVGSPGSAAGVAAEMAVGPVAAFVLGPGPGWSVALPSEEGLPALFDPALGGVDGGDAAGVRDALRSLVGPWSSMLAPEEGWLVAAIAIAAMEPLSTFRGRAAATMKNVGSGPGRLLPAESERLRREAREHGIAVGPAVWDDLSRCAGRFGVVPPAPLERSTSG